jgi:glycosyltransferase involved in cell wall biosynthesis
VRILQIHTQYREPGGEDVAADAERALLQDAGHEVISIRRENSATAARAALQLASYPWNPASTASIMGVVEEFKPQIAHIHNTWFAISPDVLRALKKADIPTVVTVHNYRLMCTNAQLLRNGAPCELCVGRVPWRGVRYRCYNGSGSASLAAAVGIQVHRTLGTWRRYVDRFIALTEFSRQRVIASGIPGDRIEVQSNFVSDPGPRQQPPSASRKVAFVGRLSPEKGLAAAIASWKQAATGDLELVIAGDGPQRAELEALAGPSVSFLGHIDRQEVCSLMLACRAMITPSIWYEGQPLGVLEGFAAATPVLGSSIGGLGETIEPLGQSWAAGPGNHRDWVNALERLTDNSLVDSGGLAARRLYERRHSPPAARRRLEGIYSKLSTGNSGQ